MMTRGFISFMLGVMVIVERGREVVGGGGLFKCPCN